MSDRKKNFFKDGYVPEKKGWQPRKGVATNGHKPETSELAPKNPPNKK
mgnify:CR=1 FL=1